MLEDGDGGQRRNSAQNRRRRASSGTATERPIHSVAQEKPDGRSSRAQGAASSAAAAAAARYRRCDGVPQLRRQHHRVRARCARRRRHLPTSARVGECIAPLSLWPLDSPKYQPAVHDAKARGHTLLGPSRIHAKLRHTLSALFPRHIESVFIDGDSFQVWQKLLWTPRGCCWHKIICVCG
jgi:hypothetical protein